MSDPYDLLRRARELIKRNEHNSENAAWLKDFKELPGAKLTKRAVHVLRDPHRLMRQNGTETLIEKLIDDSYLKIVFTHAGRCAQTRLSAQGRAALRLREEPNGTS